MTMTAERLSEIYEIAKKKRWSELEPAWLEAVSDPITDPRFYAQLTQLLVKFRREKRLEEMVQLMVMQLNDDERFLEATRILRTVLRRAPGLEGLHESLLRAIRGEYGERGNLETFIEASGLTEPANLGQKLQEFELMMISDVGSVFRHSTWGIGVVVEQDLKERQVVIDFSDKRGQRFSFSGLREFLERIPPTHILSQIARDPEVIRQRTKDDPVELVKDALASFGGTIKQPDLKSAFVPHVFTASQWSRWWTTAKDKLRLDPFLDVGLGPKGDITLRAEARSARETAQNRLMQAETMAARLQSVREAVRFLRSNALEPSEMAALGDVLQRGFEQADEPSEQLGWALLGEELAQAVEADVEIWRPDTAQILRDAGPSLEIITSIETGDHRQRALEIERAADPEQFAELCVALIEEMPLTTAKWMMKELLGDEAFQEAAKEALAQLLQDPNAHPEVYLWAMRQVLGGPWAHLSGSHDAPSLLARTLNFLQDLQRRIDREDPETPTLRGLATRIRNTLEEDRHELLVQTFKDMPVDQARSLYKHMTGLTALSDAWKHAAIQSLLNVRSDLRQRPEEEERPPLFVTAESLREKQSELQRIRTEDIPANSKDIQIAREHGDLSENAEYKAAKERQELLHRRAEELQELIDRARPIVPEAIKGDVIAPGTRARLRNLGSQQEESFTFLGMWDADPDNGIISYLSPIGQQLLRHRVGETQKVKLPSGDVTEYEILAIEKAI